MSEIRIAITGHRPKDLVDRGGRPIVLEPIIEDFLRRAVVRAKAAGHDTLTIITGGAIGVDQAVAEVVTRMRVTPLDGVRLRSCITLPFPPEVQGGTWPKADLERLKRLVSEADEVIGPLYPTFSVGGLHARNKRMVDESAYLMAFWNGKKSGGTYACISYALKSKSRAKPTYNALDGFRPLSLADL